MLNAPRFILALFSEVKIIVIFLAFFSAMNILFMEFTFPFSTLFYQIFMKYTPQTNVAFILIL